MSKNESGKSRDIELRRMGQEEAFREFRRNEIVARLAIELGRAKVGKPKKGCGAAIVPDVDAAARLLTEAEAARHREAKRPEREAREMVSGFCETAAEEWYPSLRWNFAWKRGRGGSDSGPKPVAGSGGVLNCAALCNRHVGPDTRIHIGRFQLVKSSDDFESGEANEKKWVKLGEWKVRRDENAFRGIVAKALEAEWAEKNRQRPEKKVQIVTDSDVSKYLESSEISEEFWLAIKKAGKDAGKPMNKGSAGSEAKPPRGKRKMI